MSFELPKLPYAFDALEPSIDAKTMELHYSKHHQAYIDNLNAALASYPKGQTVSLTALLSSLKEIPEPIAMKVRNNGGGHLNHTLFWQMITPTRKDMPIELQQLITKNFGSIEQFKEQFNTAAKSVFGSGWAWLVLSKEGKLLITTTANQDNPCMVGQDPLLGLDVWEHAYYLKYQNRRIEYIDAWWSVVHWDFVWHQYTMVAHH